MVIGRRSLLLAGAALPVAARTAKSQCVTDTPAVDACRGGVRITQPPGVTLDLSFMNPGTLPSGVTFTRASTATYFDSSGVMRTARTNLWLHSGDATLAASFFTAGTSAPVTTGDQTTAPDGTLTAASAAFPAVPTGETCVLYQSFTTTAAGTYTFSVYLKGVVGGEQIYIGANSGTVQYVNSPRITLTTAWQRYSITISSLGPDTIFFDVGADMRGGTATAIPAETVYAWGFQVEQGTSASPYIPTTTAPNGAPRWDYDPVTHVLRGLLIEEARTNLVLQSSSFLTAPWTVVGSPVISGTITAPDGTNTGQTIVVGPGGGAGPGFYQLVTIPSGIRAEPSIWINVTSYTATGLRLQNPANQTSGDWALNLAMLVGAGWQRITRNHPAVSVAVEFTGTAGNQCGLYAPTSGGTVTASWWGAQLEQAAFATSYIPTTAAAVTRAVEQCYINLDTWFNPNTTSLMTETYNPQVAVGIWTGTGDNNFNNALYMGVNGAVRGTSVQSLLPNVGAVNKQVVALALTRIAVSMNGGFVGSGSISVPAQPAVGQLTIGMTPWGWDNQINGHMRRVRYWPRILSDGEMQSVTR